MNSLSTISESLFSLFFLVSAYKYDIYSGVCIYARDGLWDRLPTPSFDGIAPQHNSTFSPDFIF